MSAREVVHLRSVVHRQAIELGRQDHEIQELRRELAAAKEAVVELRAMNERSHTWEAAE